jgi:hypothetical protein
VRWLVLVARMRKMRIILSDIQWRGRALFLMYCSSMCLGRHGKYETPVPVCLVDIRTPVPRIGSRSANLSAATFCSVFIFACVCDFVHRKSFQLLYLAVFFGCCAVLSGRYWPTFRRCVLHPSSGSCPELNQGSHFADCAVTSHD